MKIRFEMTFRGLCLFVPDRNEKTAKVLLVGTKDRNLPAHEPQLWIPRDQVVAEKSTWKCCGPHPKKPAEDIWNLEDIKPLEIISQVNSRLKILGPKKQNHPKKEDEKAWFCWVPNLAEAVPSISGIDEAKATCTIDLKQGELRSGRLDQNEWIFSDETQGETRTFARTVKLVLEGIDASQGVTLKSNKGDIDLIPASQTPSVISVTCANNPPPMGNGSPTLDHFRLFYNLCTVSGSWPTHLPVPKVVGELKEAIRNGSYFCPDGRLEP